MGSLNNGKGADSAAPRPTLRILCLPCGKVILRKTVPQACPRCGASAFLSRSAKAEDFDTSSSKTAAAIVSAALRSPK